MAAPSRFASRVRVAVDEVDEVASHDVGAEIGRLSWYQGAVADDGGMPVARRRLIILHDAAKGMRLGGAAGADRPDAVFVDAVALV